MRNGRQTNQSSNEASKPPGNSWEVSQRERERERERESVTFCRRGIMKKRDQLRYFRASLQNRSVWGPSMAADNSDLPEMAAKEREKKKESPICSKQQQAKNSSS